MSLLGRHLIGIGSNQVQSQLGGFRPRRSRKTGKAKGDNKSPMSHVRAMGKRLAHEKKPLNLWIRFYRLHVAPEIYLFYGWAQRRTKIGCGKEKLCAAIADWMLGSNLMLSITYTRRVVHLLFEIIALLLSIVCERYQQLE